MSDYVPLKISLKNKRRDWINTIVQIHNLQCGCEKPLDHTIKEILQQEPSLKCLTTGEDQITTDADGFGEGDLDRLFEEDFTEDATTEKDSR